MVHLQVAAKVSQSDENGSWILANVLVYDVNTDTYDVQDEDDTTRVVTLASSCVKRLRDTAQNLRKGDAVLAVFPETTSFYRAVVAKNNRSLGSGGGVSNGNAQGSSEVVLRFDDDEDESGRAPPRRVPARFVILREDVEDFDEDDK